jgi:hypothetical protein
MSQPTHTNIGHGCIEKEATDKEGRPRRGKRPMVQEHWDRRTDVKRQKYGTGDSAGSSTMSGKSKEDEVASILEKCLTVLRSGLLQDIKIDDLVFCEPSEEGDAHTPPPLQNLATTTNTQFLQYQDWIKKLSSDAEKLDCEGFERCRTIKYQLLDDLQNEWAKLEGLKRRAWQLTSRNAGLTMPVMPPCSRRIDTCERSMRCN